nr:4998_t:CDS:1 [Entrophospora candida]CAG8583288.1 14515_t:CDS:1 [Entrophospora candida]
MSRKSQTILPSVELLSSLTKEPFIDTHTHLHYVLERLPDHLGVLTYDDLKERYCPPNLEACINVLCDPASFVADGIFPGTIMDWRGMARIPFMYLAAGVHPHNAKDYNDYVEDQMIKVLENEKSLALGEIGLDYHYDNSPKDIQRTVFVRQIKKAIELGKPLVIHTREAEEDTWNIMTEHIPKEWKIHVHCFTDTPKFAEQLLGHFPNLFIGITGVVTFGSARNTQQVVISTPLNRLLLETDAPYMVPSKLNRNKKSHLKVTVCHSGMIPFVAEKISQLKNIDIDTVMKTIRENTRNMYGI